MNKLYLILAQRMFTWKRCTIQYAAIWTFFLAYFSLPYFNIWGQMTYRPETFRCIITNFDAKGNDQAFDRSIFSIELTDSRYFIKVVIL